MTKIIGFVPGPASKFAEALVTVKRMETERNRLFSSSTSHCHYRSRHCSLWHAVRQKTLRCVDCWRYTVSAGHARGLLHKSWFCTFARLGHGDYVRTGNVCRF